MEIRFYAAGEQYKDELFSEFMKNELDETAKLYGGNQDSKENRDRKRYPKSVDMIPDNLQDEYEETFKKYPDKVLTPFIKLSELNDTLSYKKIRLNNYQKAIETICHNGQRKLFNTEIQHQTSIMETSKEHALVIYAGAAPSNHSPMLGSLFPNTKYIFVDPREYNLYMDKFHVSHYNKPDRVIYMSIDPSNKGLYELDKGEKQMYHFKNPNKRLVPSDVQSYMGWESDEEFIDFILNSNYQYYLLEEIYTDKISELLNKLILHPDRISKLGKKVIFWSDIRTSFEDDSGPTDTDIIANTGMMFSWVRRLIEGVEDNFWSMIKFRPPFGKNVNWDIADPLLEGALNLGQDYKKDFIEQGCISFFEGVRYFQSFHGFDSAETRLWSTLDDLRKPLIKYPLQYHEETCFAHNLLYRFGRTFKNKYAGLVEGFDHCHDCAVEATIWEEYINKYFSSLDDNLKKNKIISLVYGLGAITGRPLNRYPHGKF